MRHIIFTIFSLFMSIALVSAQIVGVCEEITTAAIEITDAICDDIGRNEVCYGFNNVQALDFEYQALEDFVQTGDIVSISDIASLVTAPFDAENKTWGIAILSVQANLPDTLPGQNVTIILFGDTEMTSDEALDDDSLSFSGQAINGLNLRSGPGTNYVVVGGLQANEAVTVLGRNEAADWLMVELDDGDRAWIFAPLLNHEGEIEALSVRTASTNPPMQAFHITTGIGSTRCEELLPEDGLLIQAPENTRVNFLINGIEVEIGSTALIRADEESLSVSTFSGEVILESEDVSQVVAIGQQSSVARGEAPTDPKPYLGEDVRHVPVDLLPEHVDIPPPAGQNVSIARCALGGGSINVTADSPVIVRMGWATQEMPELLDFMESATVNLSYDGANQTAWSIVGPRNDPSRGDYPFLSNWYWVIENPNVGTHDLTVSFDFSRPIIVDGEDNVSSYDSVSCQLNVEG